jgi:hypothetical protein
MRSPRANLSREVGHYVLAHGGKQGLLVERSAEWPGLT